MTRTPKIFKINKYWARTHDFCVEKYPQSRLSRTPEIGSLANVWKKFPQIRDTTQTDFPQFANKG